MSITFTVNILNEAENCYHQVPGTPEINLSNSNAYQLMNMLETEPVSVDLWTNDQLDEVERRICYQLLHEDIRQDYVRPTQEYKGSGGCTIIHCGASDDYWVQKLKSLREVVRSARQHNGVVFWA
jgi:hypothetical protein